MNFTRICMAITMRMKILLFLLTLEVVESFIFPGQEFDFLNGTLVGTVQDQRVVKTSGCAASRRHPGVLYIHNDHHHGGAIIFAINSTTAKVLGSIVLTNAVNDDWEDIAVGPCPTVQQQHCIYIGDIGTDKGHPSINNVYLLAEPPTITGDQQLQADKELQFSYSELGSDTMMVDNYGELYVVGYRRGGNSGFFHIPKSAWNAGSRIPVSSNVQIGLDTGDEKDPLAGDISPDGHNLLIKTHYKMYLWSFKSGDGSNVFDKQPFEVPYTYVWQDEAVCWAYDGSGYYTIPEGTNPPLHFYQRVNN